ncbi:MAG: hypothetical protein JWQ19_1261 [Subtercola sp.]|nr:hypothetical protein [Subtercola sp.]
MEYISVRFTPGIARITLARGAQRNAINAALAAELVAVIGSLEREGVIVAVLDAQGPAFCAGADLSELETATAAVDSVVEAMLSVPVHWTAAVAGAARGAALSLLAACPRVLATPEATFGLPELAKGFFPTDVIDLQVAVLGVRGAFDLAFRATPIGAVDAQSIGLVSEVVQPDELEARLARDSGALASADPNAVKEGVRLWQTRLRAAVNGSARL